MNNYLPFIYRGFSSFFNIFVIWILAWYLSNELTGKLLYVISAIYIISAIVRLGWDQAIIANNLKNKIFITNIFITSLILFLIIISLNIYIPAHEFLNNKFYIFFLIFFTNLSVNLECLLRIANNSKKTYFVALNSNMLGLLLSVFIFNKIDNIFVFQSLFSCLVMIAALLAVEKKIIFSTAFISPQSSLKYFPLGIHGAFNQNILQFGLGAIGCHLLIPFAVTIQKFCGFIAWPINFFIFTKGNSIKSSFTFSSQFNQQKIVFGLFIFIALGLSIWLYIFNLQLVLPSLILLCGYYVYATKGDNLYVRIYNHQYKYIYIVQFVVFAILLVIKYRKLEINYYWIFIINAIYLILISSHLRFFRKIDTND